MDEKLRKLMTRLANESEALLVLSKLLGIGLLIGSDHMSPEFCQWLDKANAVLDKLDDGLRESARILETVSNPVPKVSLN